MTKLLDQALEAARALPTAEQDDIARIVLRLAGAGQKSPIPLSTTERHAINASKSAAARNDFATDDEIRALWAKHAG